MKHTHTLLTALLLVPLHAADKSLSDFQNLVQNSLPLTRFSAGTAI
jgi:hypothetical protein